MHISYEGTDLLTLLKEAHHYNSSITRSVLHAAGKTKTLVDFGAGIGTFAELLRGEGRQIICVDADENHRKLLGKSGFAAHARVSDVIPAQSFVYTLNVLEHISDDTGVLREIFDFLTPGGILFVYVPAMPLLWTDLDDRVGHQRRYSLPELRSKLRGAGFRVEKIRYTDSAGVIAALVFKILGRKTADITRQNVLFYDRVIFRISQVMDIFAGRFAGKNLVAVARKP